MILFYIECCRSILSSCLLAAKTHPLLVKPQVLGLSLLVQHHDQTPGRSVDGPVTFDRCSSFGLQGWAQRNWMDKLGGTTHVVAMLN